MSLIFPVVALKDAPSNTTVSVWSALWDRNFTRYGVLVGCFRCLASLEVNAPTASSIACLRTLQSTASTAGDTVALSAMSSSHVTRQARRPSCCTACTRRL